MRRLLILSLISFSWIIPLYAAENGRKPVLFIQTLENPTGSQDASGEVVKRSIKLIIDLKKKYQVVYSDNLAEYLSNTALSNTPVSEETLTLSYVKANFPKLGFDEIIYGSFRPQKNGDEIEVRLNVLQLVENKIKYERVFTMPTDADIFDGIDRIGISLDPVLSGIKLGYGTIAVSTSVEGSRIFINGRRSTRNNYRQETAIAGLTHKVEIRNKNGDVLFSRDVTVQDKWYYDLTYDYKEFVETIDTSSTNKVTRSDYEKKSPPPAPRGTYSKLGLKTTAGGGGFAWAGIYWDLENLSLCADLTVLPRIPDYLYDWYLGAKFSATLSVFRPDSAWFNPYLTLGYAAYYGLELQFMPNNPYTVLGAGVSVVPDWDFVPGFMRKWQISLEVSTFQDGLLLFKQFAAPDMEDSKTMINRGGPMLSLSVKF